MLLENKKYLKSQDVKGGEFITFKNSGEWIENKKFTYPDGTPRQDFVIKVEINEQERDLRLNKTNRDLLIKVFGNDTDNWVGQTVKLNKVKALVSGKMMDILRVEVEQPIIPEDEPEPD